MTVYIIHRTGIGCCTAVLGVGLTTAALAPFQAEVSVTTVALAYLLLVLFLATLWGRAPAAVASVLATAAFDFFFLPPIHTFAIAQRQNWLALAAIVITAVIARDVAERAKRLAGPYRRSLIEAALDPLVTISPVGTITVVNTATEVATGY